MTRQPCTDEELAMSLFLQLERNVQGSTSRNNINERV